MITLNQMTAALKTLYSTYPSVKLDDRAIEEWLCIFEKYPLESFEQAFRAAKFVSSEFVPTPGLVMKELRSIGATGEANQKKEWVEYANGSVQLEITTEFTDDKGKHHTEKRQYKDLSKDEKWRNRKLHFAAGRWLCIEEIGDKRYSYSYQKWPLKESSSIYTEGGFHRHNGEELPFLVRM